MAVNLNRLAELFGYYQDAVSAEASALTALDRARELQRYHRAKLVELIGEKTLSDLLAKEAANVQN